MAGERLAKITIEACLADLETVGNHPPVQLRGLQTEHIRFRLAGVWIDYYRGAKTSLRQFVVPDPEDAKRDYVKQAVENLLVLVKFDIQSRGLSYIVSEPRDLGNSTNGNHPRIAFDIEATQYQQVFDLDFQNTYTGDPNGWTITQNLAGLHPFTVTPTITPAGTYGSATGSISLFVFDGNTLPYTFKWADDPTATTGERLKLKAGTYVCVVSDQSGVSQTVTCVVKSDAQLTVVVQQTEDSITLVVSGGVAPYAVAWDDGNTDFARTGLVPGTYAGTVTDARGASQRVVVQLLSGRYYWSRNPVEVTLDAGDAYRLNPTTKPNLSFVAEVWLEPVYLSGVFLQVGPRLEQPADGLGRTTFDVRGQLDAYLADLLPAPTGELLERADPLFRRFYLKTAEQFGDPVPAVAALASARVQFVLRGGLPEEEALAGTWFTYQAAAKPFLTWDPDYQRLLPTQPAYLSYQHLGAAGALQLVRRVRHLDGSATAGEVVATVPGARRFEVYTLRVGPAALGLTGEEVAGYDVWVADAQGTVLSAVRHFELERAYYPQQRFVLYTNSLGGVNSLAMVGQAKHALEVVSREAARPRYDPQLGDTVTYDRLGQPTLSLVSAKRRRAQAYADQDVLLSRRATLCRGGQYWPGQVVAATFVVRDEAEGLQSLSFDFRLPTQRQFGPRLPAVVAGQALTPLAGGEGAQP